MIQKKICMLGAFAVGKTSLVRRYVQSIFSEAYQTTIGVKIDKKIVTVDEREMQLIVWDLAGEDRFNGIQSSYLRGAAGYLMVADGTRPATIDEAFRLHARLAGSLEGIPGMLAMNKTDLTTDWRMTAAATEMSRQRSWETIATSAKTGQGVEELFLGLARRIST